MTTPKLLLADDSITIRKVVELTFADEGIDVSTATDGAGAMQKFVDIQPDIVMVDVGLDGTSGYQICEMIKLDEATKHIPVLLLVGSFEPFDQDEATRVGADGYLTKPFPSIRELVAQVSSLLGKGHGGNDIHPPTISAAKLEETSDIDSLYKSSFEETVTMDDLDTLDDMLGNPGMDDEMIEASYQPAAVAPSAAEGEQTKEFDWSPEALISEAGFVNEEKIGPAGNTSPDDAGFSTNVIDPVMSKQPDDHAELKEEKEEADESAGAELPADVEEDRSEESEPEELSDNEEVEFDGQATISEGIFEAIPLAEAEEPESETGKTDAVETESVENEEDAEAEKDGQNHPTSEIMVNEAGAAEDGGVHDLDPNETTKIVPADIAAGAGIEEPSDEFIALVSRRVIEKLSVNVIREIAQHAVPRIAEKLIREALEDEKKA